MSPSVSQMQNHVPTDVSMEQISHRYTKPQTIICHHGIHFPNAKPQIIRSRHIHANDGLRSASLPLYHWQRYANFHGNMVMVLNGWNQRQLQLIRMRVAKTPVLQGKYTHEMDTCRLWTVREEQNNIWRHIFSVNCVRI